MLKTWSSCTKRIYEFTSIYEEFTTHSSHHLTNVNYNLIHILYNSQVRDIDMFNTCDWGDDKLKYLRPTRDEGESSTSKCATADMLIHYHHECSWAGSTTK